MSFGFSVGDFLAVAQLAYTLGKALSDSKGAVKEYGDLITELNIVHRVLLHINDLRAANQIAKATMNALLFTVNSTNVTMETFLEEHKEYEKSLRPESSKNLVKNIYKKGKWATEMPDKVKYLQRSLATMLAAINCLLSLACYYKTEYDPKCRAYLDPGIGGAWAQDYVPTCSWKNIKVEAGVREVSRWKSRYCPGFDSQPSPASFFRPGQIFAAQITSNFRLRQDRAFRKVDFGNLPLEPVSNLQTMTAIESLENRNKRLAQIRQLPLEQMTRYCQDIPLERENVHCLLCPDSAQNSYNKDDWATSHFRISHWRQYFGMIPEKSYMPFLGKEKIKKIVPWEKQEHPQGVSHYHFPGDIWITLEDVAASIPIKSDKEIARLIARASEAEHHLAGPVMIQRFVVVREGDDYCLCLGIHTYARRGCGNQLDQDLFGVLSSEKVPPPLQPDETRIVLSPVRMKPDHPSKTLPSTARIHYGRAYELEHKLFVQPLGLVHPGSMETLLDQFTASATNLEHRKLSDNALEQSELNTQAADMQVVKEIRADIATILGPNLSPVYHPPSEILSSQRAGHHSAQYPKFT